MDLQITITLSDKLFELLEDKLPNLGRRVECALTKELGRTLRSESEISVKTLSSAGKPEGGKGSRPKRRRKPEEKDDATGEGNWQPERISFSSGTD